MPTEDLEEAREIFPFNADNAYHLPTPYNAFGAAAILAEGLEISDKGRPIAEIVPISSAEPSWLGCMKDTGKSEQNLHYEVGGVGRVNPATYAALLRPAYLAIKAANPTLMVISGGLMPTGAPLPYALDDIEYLSQLYDLGAKNYFDAVGAHPGGYNCPALADWRTVMDPTALFQAPFTVRHHSWCFLGTMEGYRDAMLAKGDGNKRIAVTEFGWASAANPASPYTYAADNTYAEQAQWIVEAYQWGRNVGWVNLMILWNLDFGVYYPPSSPLTYWSLVLQPGPVPAYSAVASMPR